MTSASISTFRDKEASVFTAVASDGRVGTVAFRSSLTAEGARFSKPMAALFGALDRLAVESQPQFGRLLPSALADEIRRLVVRIVAPTFRATRDDVQQAKRDNAARRVRISEPPSDLSLATEDRQWFRSLELAQQARWIAVADRSQLAALLVAGRARFPDLPDALWSEVVERHAVLAHVERTGLQADFQRRPTPDDPACIGPDIDAAERVAREAVQRFDEDESTIEDAENALRTVIVATAVAADLSIEAAFSLLTETT